MATRRLVLLFDGTWSQPESDTSVERLRRLIASADAAGAPQLVNYIAGVGAKPGLTHWLGGAFGLGLSDNIMRGYRWLCETWQPGDALYLFGFSRGGYTARSLAGMIRKCGLLKRSAEGDVGAPGVAAAYTFYRTRATAPDDPAAVDFRAAYAFDIEIHFIGVWDTVGELGIPDVAAWFPFARLRYRFHDTELSKIVKYAYHALALDEHRADMAPTVWTRNPDTLKRGETLTSKKVEQIEIEQRWFIGAHADVGGGAAHDGAGRAPDPLPELPLAWLQRKADAAGLRSHYLLIPEPDAGMGTPRDSYAEFLHGFYKCFVPPFNRRFGDGVNETIDSSVWQRWSVDGKYRSATIVTALAEARLALPAVTAAPERAADDPLAFGADA